MKLRFSGYCEHGFECLRRFREFMFHGRFEQLNQLGIHILVVVGNMRHSGL